MRSSLANSKLQVCFSALLAGTMVASVTAQKPRRTATLEVTQGKTARHTLTGAQYLRLTTVRVLQASSRKPARGLVAKLGAARRGSRTLVVQASTRAALGADYRIEGLADKRVVMTVPLRIRVIAGNRPKPAAGTKPPRKSARRPARPAPRPARIPTAKRQSSVSLQRGAERWLDLPGSRYAAATDARVLRDGRLTSELIARVEKAQGGTRVVVSSGRQAALTRYTLQVKVDGRWTTVPLTLATSELPPSKAGASSGGGTLARVPVETITMPDGTKVSLGPNKGHKNSGEFNYEHKAIVTGWSPTRAAVVNGTVTISGTSLPPGVVVKIGDKTLRTKSYEHYQVVAEIPGSSDACPPGTLAVYDAGGTLIRKCRDHYFVKGDKPFHHFVPNGSQHQWINSYLLAVTSLAAYADGESWTEFQPIFAKKLRALGLNEFEFAAEITSFMDSEVMIAANPEVIVLAVRGSEGKGNDGILQDWLLTDFNLFRKSVDSWKKDAWVHVGFYNAWDAVHDDVKTKIKKLRNNNQAIFVCGHSLGGAVVSLGAYRLARDGLPIEGVYTYASPRAGNMEWADAYTSAGLQSRTQRWSNKLDIVPRYPGLLPGWMHVGKTNNIYLDSTIKLDDDEIMMALAWTVSHHSMVEYLGEIYDDLSPETRALVGKKPN